MGLRSVAWLMACCVAASGCRRPGTVLPLGAQQNIAERIEAFRRADLEPARLPPPAIDFSAQRIEVDGVIATARPLRPEDAEWNHWPTGGHRLFNNRAALLFELDIRGSEPILWAPRATTLELNDERTTIAAAETTEALLADLLSHAFLEEQWSVPGDLVDRARGAGPFRSAYLPLHDPGGTLDGIIAFPLWAGPQQSLAELHVVAVRLKVSVTVGDQPRELVWVFE